MTNAQTEARAIARLEYVHGSEGYALRPDAGGRYVLYTDHVAALAALEAKLAEARKALGLMLTEHDTLSRTGSTGR